MNFTTWLKKQSEIFKKSSQGYWISDNGAREYQQGDSFSENGAGIYLSENNHSNIVNGGQQNEQGGGVGFEKNEDAEFTANSHNTVPFYLDVLIKIAEMHATEKINGDQSRAEYCKECGMLYPCKTIRLIETSYEKLETMYEK